MCIFGSVAMEKSVTMATDAKSFGCIELSTQQGRLSGGRYQPFSPKTTPYNFGRKMAILAHCVLLVFGIILLCHVLFLLLLRDCFSFLWWAAMYSLLELFYFLRKWVHLAMLYHMLSGLFCKYIFLLAPWQLVCGLLWLDPSCLLLGSLDYNVYYAFEEFP